MERTHLLSLLFAFLYLYDDLGGTLERTLDYGPYGESLGTDWAATSAPAARKLFIGKEKLKSDDTELYDFGARRYDPALPRWTSVDPLAGKYPGLSQYAYCAGNPVCVVDPNGEAWYIIDIEGYITKNDNRKGEQFDILFKMSDNGSIDSRGLKIYNQTILSELEKNSETPLLPSYSDLKEVFFFVADTESDGE